MGEPRPQMEIRLSDDQFELQEARFSRLPEGSPIGVVGQSLEVAGDYALTREQSNVPIGAFQALKHLVADMSVHIELAPSATYAAGGAGLKPVVA
jgi:alkylation response protein AidB-like acyl-CoA dehydrogenase